MAQQYRKSVIGPKFLWWGVVLFVRNTLAESYGVRGSSELPHGRHGEAVGTAKKAENPPAMP